MGLGKSCRHGDLTSMRSTANWIGEACIDLTLTSSLRAAGGLKALAMAASAVE